MPTAERQGNKGGVAPPGYLSRAEKNAFRRLSAALNTEGKPISAGQIEVLADFVKLRSRIATLEKMLRAEVAKKSEFDSIKSRIVAVSRQIDSSTRLSMALGEKLGLAGTAATN
ncbi:hypothetical protein ACSBOB_20710 [Mesorhizobium sp. ASY16-5R]|uniref:hypothetical protein n=1 Tax=Mesorhizobium sp. ASY16-5R TaxID=3445772 RepID=UPI003FA0B34D